MSYDEDFVQEVRYVLRHAVANLTKRVYRVDLTTLITKTVIPAALTHVDALIHSSDFVNSDMNTKELDLDLQKAFVEYMGPNLHPAVLSREKEVDYTSTLTSKLVPLLIPRRYKSSKSVIASPIVHPK